jgi:3-oxoadipate enol-lactonase
VTGPRDAPWLSHIETHGVPSWARETMPGRFGTALPPKAIEWWIDLMAKTPKTTLQGYLRWVPQVDITEDVKKIACPVFIIAPDANARRKVEVTQAWVKTIKQAELKVMKLDGWHIGGAYPDICAPAIAEFFGRG